MTKLIALAASVAAIALAGTADAAITVYTNQAAYLAAISNPGVDTFETLSITAVTASPITRSAGAYGYTAAASSGFYGAGSSADHWLSTNSAGDDMTFSGFTGGVYGVGGRFFGTDIDGAFTPTLGITLMATDASGSVTQSILNPTTSSFLGFVSTTGITGFTIFTPSNFPGAIDCYFPTANNLTLGGRLAATPGVPEPATWAMMIAGFGLVGGAMRRRRVRVAFA